MKRQSITGSLGIVMALNVARSAMALVRQAVFTRMLGPAGFGAFGLALDTIMGIPLNIVTLGIPSSYSRYVQQYEKKGKLTDFIVRTTLPTASLAFLATVVCVVFSSEVSQFIFKTPTRGWLVLIVALSILPEAVGRHVRSCFTGMRMFFVGAVADFMPVALFSIFGVALVLLVARTAESAAAAQVIGSWVTIVVFGILLWRHLRKVEPVRARIDEPEFSLKIFLFSISGLIMPLEMLALSLVDRWMLTRMKGLAEVGIYSVAFNVSDYVILFGSLTASVLGPNMSHMWEEGDREGVMKRINFALRLTLMVLLGVAVFLLGVSPWVIRLICGDAYAASASLVWVFLIYQLFNSAFHVLGLYPLLVERPLMSLYALTSGLVVNVAANLWLIPRYGVMGGAISAMVSMFTVVVVLAVQCRMRGFKFEWRSLVVMALMFLPAIPSRIGLLVASTGVLAVTLFTDWILSPEERGVLVDKIRGMLRGHEA